MPNNNVAIQKCENCGRTIQKGTSKLCFYCSNKEKIEAGEFKPKKSEKVAEFKKWNK